MTLKIYKHIKNSIQTINKPKQVDKDYLRLYNTINLYDFKSHC